MAFFLVSMGLFWFLLNKPEPEFPFPDLYIEKLADGGYEIQVGVDGVITPERKAAMLKELKRITGEENSAMEFTVDPIKHDCTPPKDKLAQKSDCYIKNKKGY